MSDVKNIRKSNLELLRIICMIMIVAHHYVVHGTIWYDNTMSLNKYFIQLYGAGGKISVYCFVLISGYFLSTSKSSRWKSLVKLWIQVTFFSMTIILLR